ncbi:hypothetical protein EDC19_2121 [Natranaerovirga hydrolytica]|uniref:Uncharacterized protein n=1 Tax=Natranaerovirga hydrolytica TaxID=680378 RepID=A0A4R1MID3_9FIRM|nr:hypothetical protein [Natranaerovirga hydrolytica]TCK92386.1 hypothetical protein EDC19_2121 [Natranaerovirga hydrolytica]
MIMKKIIVMIMLVIVFFSVGLSIRKEDPFILKEIDTSIYDHKGYILYYSNDEGNGDIKLKVLDDEIIIAENINEEYILNDNKNGFFLETLVVDEEDHSIIVAMKNEFVTKYGSKSRIMLISREGGNLIRKWDSESEIGERISINAYNEKENTIELTVNEFDLTAYYNQDIEIDEFLKSSENQYLEKHTVIDFNIIEKDQDILFNTTTIMRMGYVPLTLEIVTTYSINDSNVEIVDIRLNEY